MTVYSSRATEHHEACRWKILEEAAASVCAGQRKFQNQLGWSDMFGTETLESSTGNSCNPKISDSGINSSASQDNIDLVKPETLCDIADKLCCLKHQQNMSATINSGMTNLMRIPFKIRSELNQ